MNGSTSATLCALVVGVGPFLVPAVARADEPAPEVPRHVAALSYSRDAGAEACPDENWLRDAVVRRLGEDPFGPAPSQRFRVDVTRVGARFIGHIALYGAAREPAKTREFEASGDCAELVDALGLAISLAIKPDLVVTAAPEEPAAEAAPAAAQTPPPPAPAAAAPPPPVTPSREGTPAGPPSSPPNTQSHSLALDAGLFALGAVGVGPSPSYGGSLAVRLTGLDALSVSLEARADAAGTSDLPAGGTVRTRLISGVLAPCWHVSVVAGCAVLLAGAFHAETRGANAAGSDSAPYVGLGARFAAEYEALPRLTLQFRAELLGALRPPTIWRNTTEAVWSAPPVSVGVGLGVLTPIL